MKKAAFFIMFVFLATSITAQQDALALRRKNTYCDAVQLTKLYKEYSLKVDPNTRISILMLLRSYNWTTSDNSNYIFSKTLDLNSILTKPPIKLNDTLEQPLNQLESLTSIFSAPSTESATGNWQSIAINALATFMAKRAKEEIMYYAVDGIFNAVTDTAGKEKIKAELYKKLFPETIDYVEFLKKSGVYYYSDFAMLKQKVETDLNKIPYSVYEYLPSEKPFLKEGAYIASSVLETVRNGSLITELINNLGSSDSVWLENNTKYFLHALQIMSNAMKTTEGSDHIWLSGEEISNLDPAKFTGNLTQHFFYGLILQQLKGQPEFRLMIEKTDSKQAVEKIVTALFDLNNLCYKLNSLKDNFNKAPAIPQFNWYLSVTRQTVDLIKEANNIISKVLPVKIIPQPVFNQTESVLSFAEKIDQKKYYEAISIIMTGIINKYDLDHETVRRITFFIQLGNITDEKQFENFLISYCEPIGSSVMKRTAKFNFSLNGYAGVDCGKEFLMNSKLKENKNSFFAGVSAPIGLAFSFCPRKCGSWSIITTVIDIGSLVNARWKGDSTQYSNLRFDQFLSPGLGVAYNFRGTPITLAARGNFVPNLVDVNYSDGAATISERRKNVFRASLSLLIDIPFITFANTAADRRK